MEVFSVPLTNYLVLLAGDALRSGPITDLPCKILYNCVSKRLVNVKFQTFAAYAAEESCQIATLSNPIGSNRDRISIFLVYNCALKFSLYPSGSLEC